MFWSACITMTCSSLRHGPTICTKLSPTICNWVSLFVFHCLGWKFVFGNMQSETRKVQGDVIHYLMSQQVLWSIPKLHTSLCLVLLCVCGTPAIRRAPRYNKYPCSVCFSLTAKALCFARATHKRQDGAQWLPNDADAPFQRGKSDNNIPPPFAKRFTNRSPISCLAAAEMIIMQMICKPCLLPLLGFMKSE